MMRIWKASGGENEENIKTPIDSNSWWSSAMVQTFSSLLCVTPLKAKYSTKGLGVLTATSGWVGTRGINDLGTDQSSETGAETADKADDADTPVKGYQIQYSTNGIDFTTVKTVSGAEAKAAWLANSLIDVQEVSATGAVRYIRIYYPDAYNYGIQVREIAVLSTEQNIQKIEVEKCDPPLDVTVVSNHYCELTYTITSGVGQEDYQYIVYLDGIKIQERIDNHL